MYLTVIFDPHVVHNRQTFCNSYKSAHYYLSMPPKGSGRGRGRGRGRPKVMKIETERQREAWELVEAKKHQLIEFVKQYPVLYNISHPDHLNSQITIVLWEEIAEKLGEAGTKFYSYNNNMQILTHKLDKLVNNHLNNVTIIFRNILHRCSLFSKVVTIKVGCGKTSEINSIPC